MRTVSKFPLMVGDRISVSMPVGAQILRFEMQEGVPTLWALVDDRAPVETRRFRLAGTGDPLDDLRGEVCYLGTIFPPSGLVFHLFEFER